LANSRRGYTFFYIYSFIFIKFKKKSSSVICRINIFTFNKKHVLEFFNSHIIYFCYMQWNILKVLQMKHWKKNCWSEYINSANNWRRLFFKFYIYSWTQCRQCCNDVTTVLVRVPPKTELGSTQANISFNQIASSKAPKLR
jgi:hypothetical protein